MAQEAFVTRAVLQVLSPSDNISYVTQVILQILFPTTGSELASRRIIVVVPGG